MGGGDDGRTSRAFLPRLIVKERKGQWFHALSVNRSQCLHLKTTSLDKLEDSVSLSSSFLLESQTPFSMQGDNQRDQVSNNSEKRLSFSIQTLFDGKATA